MWLCGGFAFCPTAYKKSNDNPHIDTSLFFLGRVLHTHSTPEIFKYFEMATSLCVVRIENLKNELL